MDNVNRYNAINLYLGRTKEELTQMLMTGYDPVTNKKAFDEGWSAQGMFAQGFVA